MAGKRTFKQKPKWGILITVVILLLGAYLVQERKKSNAIDKCPRYTIAYTTTVGDKKVNYKYSIVGRNFTGYWYQNPRSTQDYFSGDFVAKNFIGQRFLVRVNCNEPEINEIDWTHSIPEHIGSAPEEGWKAIPENFPKTKFAD